MSFEVVESLIPHEKLDFVFCEVGSPLSSVEM